MASVILWCSEACGCKAIVERSGQVLHREWQRMLREVAYRWQGAARYKINRPAIRGESCYSNTACISSENTLEKKAGGGQADVSVTTSEGNFPQDSKIPGFFHGVTLWT